MTSDWKTYTLSEVCLKITDGAHQSPKSVDIGKPMCSVKDLTEFGLMLKTARRISEDDYEILLRQGCMPQVGDVLIAKDGNSALDTACSIDTPVETVLLSSVAILRPNPNVLDTDFLKYYFKSKQTIEYLKSNFISGAAIPRVVLKDFKKAVIRLPDLDEQREISKPLRSLDDKIQLNHQINQTLEQMAQAIFKSWFVDFDPVKAKIAAKEHWLAMQPMAESASPVCYADDAETLPDLETYMNLAAMQAISGKDEEALACLQAKQPEKYAELRETAALFPSAMQESKLGEVPEGWTDGILSDLAEFHSERVSTDKLSHETYISTENMLENKKGICAASSLPSSTSVPGFDPGQVLISNIRPYFKKIWLSNIYGGRSPDVLGFKSKHEGTTEFLFNVLFQDQFFDYMMLTSKGAKMPRGDKKAIMRFACTVAPIELMKRFSERIASFYTLATSNNLESKLLSSIRDTLLPKLLSGEFRVTDSEAQIVDAEEVASV